MINESRGEYQTRESRIRTRTIIDPFETRTDLSPGRPKVEGRRPIRSTGELDLKDAFISLPFEQNLPRGLMLRLLSFNGLLIVQHPGRRRVERCPPRMPIPGGIGKTRAEFSSGTSSFAKIFLLPRRASRERTKRFDDNASTTGGGSVFVRSFGGGGPGSRETQGHRFQFEERRIPLPV